MTRVRIAHDEHSEMLGMLADELLKRKVQFQSLAREDLNSAVTDVDLVIAVGGDGTFLDASHFVQNVPLLGVNSSRSSSFGHFCLANDGNLSKILDEIESGARKPL